MSTETMDPVWTMPAPTTDAELALLSDYIKDQEHEVARLKVYRAARIEPIDEAIEKAEAKIAEARQQAHIYLRQLGVSKVSLPDVGTWFTQTRTKVEYADKAAAEAEAIRRDWTIEVPARLDIDWAKVEEFAKVAFKAKDGEAIPGVTVKAVESIALRRK